jgi:PAS domain-containing protein
LVEAKVGNTAQVVAEANSVGRRLPIPEYAVLVPTGISRSAVVVADFKNKAASSGLSIETFPQKEVAAGGLTFSATDQEIATAGLADVFTAGPGMVIHTIPADSDDPGAGILLVKVPESESIDAVRNLLEVNAGLLEKILTRARQVAAAHERAILKGTFHFTAPSVVVDSAQRVVFANAMFAELVGIAYDDLTGSQLTDFIHLDRGFETDAPEVPEHEEMTTPLFVKTQSLFFVSDVRLSRLATPCGERLIYTFADLSTERRRGNSNIQLIQKLSAMMIGDEPPQAVLRRLVNALALTLGCDLVCIMKKKKKSNDEMIATPYTNRRLETLRINFIQPKNEPVLQPYVSHGTPVLCDDVEKACGEQSFFRRVLPMSAFALVPAGQGRHADYALLMAWSRTGTAAGTEALPLLRVVANLLAAVLASAKQSREVELERETLRRFTAATAGREAKMAGLKKENARLRELVANLSETTEE